MRKYGSVDDYNITTESIQAAPSPNDIRCDDISHFSNGVMKDLASEFNASIQ